MQTFLPYPNFKLSAQCLDDRRLGKQRVECKQILRVLHGFPSSYRNHPAVKMWKGFDEALWFYYNAVVEEWQRRGKRNIKLMMVSTPQIPKMPSWLGDKDFHNSHRSALLYKKPEWYSKFEWTDKPKIAYVWPVL